MDRALIESKLESLRRCVKRAEDRCPETPQALAEDADLQDIVSLNLTRAVQLCVDIAAHMIAESEAPAPQTMGESFDGLLQIGIVDAQLARRLKRAVGFRNIAVHNYQAINWTIVHAICIRGLEDFKDFARVVAKRLET